MTAPTKKITGKESALYQRGRDAFARGDLAEAERCLLPVLASHRDYADLYAILGAIYHDKGKFVEAIKLFAKALQINPAFTEAKVNLMVLFQDLGRYDRSKGIFRELQQGADALPQSPDPLSKNRLANLHAVTGDMYFAVELLDLAVREYEQALELRPGFADIRLKLSRALLAGGKFELAEVQCRSCLSARPEDNHARVFLGSILMAQGRKAQALDAWRQVLTLEPEHEDAARLLYVARGGTDGEGGPSPTEPEGNAPDAV